MEDKKVVTASGESRALPLSQPVYLKTSVKLEPLVCGWLAWPHLLSPVQSAMNMAFRYIPLLHSFVANHQVHVAATKDPKLFGGPFVHLSANDIPAVKDLIVRTNTLFSRLLRLANDVKAFNTVVQAGCKGFSLNDMYAMLPDSLAGMVELMYDINNNPRMHFIEVLLADEYDEILRGGAQTISLSSTCENNRHFFLSTPRLSSPSNLVLNVEFANPSLDVLTSMRVRPRPLKQIAETFGCSDIALAQSNFFSAEPPERHRCEYREQGVRIRYFGHACVLIQTIAVSILIDPLFAYAEEDRDSENTCTRFTVGDLPDVIDFLVISHCHQDHFSPEMLLGIRSRVRQVVVPTNNRGSIVDPSMKFILQQLGFSAITSLGQFDEIAFPNGKMASIPFPGEHADLDVYSKQSIFLEVLGRRLLFLVDSDGQDQMMYKRVATRLLSFGHHIDALFIGMECHGAPLTWLYGPLLSGSVTRRDDDSRRLSGLNCESALAIVDQFNCRRVYVYGMGQEPWLKYMMGLEYGADSVQLVESQKLVEQCRAKGITSARLFGSQDIFV